MQIHFYQYRSKDTALTFPHNRQQHNNCRNKRDLYQSYNPQTKTISINKIRKIIKSIFKTIPLPSISIYFRKKGLKRLKQVRVNMPNFKEVPFIKSTSQDELKQMAKSLGIKIKFEERS